MVWHELLGIKCFAPQMCCSCSAPLADGDTARGVWLARCYRLHKQWSVTQLLTCFCSEGLCKCLNIKGKKKSGVSVLREEGIQTSVKRLLLAVKSELQAGLPVLCSSLGSSAVPSWFWVQASFSNYLWFPMSMLVFGTKCKSQYMHSMFYFKSLLHSYIWW